MKRSPATHLVNKAIIEIKTLADGLDSDQYQQAGYQTFGIWSRKLALSRVFSWTTSSGRRRTEIRVDDLPILDEDYWTALEILAEEIGNIKECTAQGLPWYPADAGQFRRGPPDLGELPPR